MASPAPLFHALGHPLRLALLEGLRRGERAAGDLPVPPGTSQPVVSQHLAVLRKAGLVRVRREGRRRLYSVEGGAVRRVRRWADRYGRFRDRRLLRPKRCLEEGRP